MDFGNPVGEGLLIFKLLASCSVLEAFFAVV